MKPPIAAVAINLATTYYLRAGFDVYHPAFKTDFHLLLVGGPDALTEPLRVVVVGLHAGRDKLAPLKTRQGGEAVMRTFDLLFAVNIDTLSIWEIPSSDLPLTESVFFSQRYENYRRLWSTMQRIDLPPLQPTKQAFANLPIHQPPIILPLPDIDNADTISDSTLVDDVFKDE